jgi:hypothetical protein
MYTSTRAGVDTLLFCSYFDGERANEDECKSAPNCLLDILLVHSPHHVHVHY